MGGVVEQDSKQNLLGQGDGLAFLPALFSSVGQTLGLGVKLEAEEE